MRPTSSTGSVGIEAPTATTGLGAAVMWGASMSCSATSSTTTQTTLDWFLGGGDDIVFMGFTGAPLVASGSF